MKNKDESLENKDISLEELESIKRDFKVKSSFITMEQKASLIKNYVEALYKDKNIVKNYLSAEYGLMLELFDSCTNVDIKRFSGTNINKLVTSDLWEVAKTSLKNYEELRADIEKVLELLKYEKSAESSANQLLAKLSGVLDSIAKVDLSEEGIKKLIGALNTEAEKINKFYPTVKVETSVESPKEIKPRGRKPKAK
jgi:hypothetical protein